MLMFCGGGPGYSWISQLIKIVNKLTLVERRLIASIRMLLVVEGEFSDTKEQYWHVVCLISMPASASNTDT